MQGDFCSGLGIIENEEDLVVAELFMAVGN